MKKLPVYKMKWFVGSKIQISLIIYFVSLAVLSQLFVIVTEFYIVEGPYTQYIIFVLNVIYYGFLIYGYWLTNRIAGPLYRLKRHIDEMTEGETDTEIQFRKNDYGSDIAESLNVFIKNKINKS